MASISNGLENTYQHRSRDSFARGNCLIWIHVPSWCWYRLVSPSKPAPVSNPAGQGCIRLCKRMLTTFLRSLNKFVPPQSPTRPPHRSGAAHWSGVYPWWLYLLLPLIGSSLATPPCFLWQPWSRSLYWLQVGKKHSHFTVVYYSAHLRRHPP